MGSERGGAQPQTTALGQGAEVAVVVPVDSKPATASSLRHSSAERNGDERCAHNAGCHQLALWPKTTSQSALGSASTAMKSPPGTSRSRRPAREAASSRKRAQAFIATMTSKTAPFRLSFRSSSDQRQAETPTKDLAREESRAACSESVLAAMKARATPDRVKQLRIRRVAPPPLAPSSRIRIGCAFGQAAANSTNPSHSNSIPGAIAGDP